MAEGATLSEPTASVPSTASFPLLTAKAPLIALLPFNVTVPVPTGMVTVELLTTASFHAVAIAAPAFTSTWLILARRFVTISPATVSICRMLLASGEGVMSP